MQFAAKFWDPTPTGLAIEEFLESGRQSDVSSMFQIHRSRWIWKNRRYRTAWLPFLVGFWSRFTLRSKVSFVETLSIEFLLKPLRIPDLFSKPAVQLLPSIQVGLFELRARFEWQFALFYKPPETRVMFVCGLVQTSCEQILSIVLLELFLIRQVAIARIERFRK